MFTETTTAFNLTLKERVELCGACGAMRRELEDRINNPNKAKWFTENYVERYKERIVELDRLAKLMLDGPDNGTD